MDSVEGFPYLEFELGKDGHIVQPSARGEALAFFGGGQVSDLLIISHGWNNDMAEARHLYSRFLAELRKLVDAQMPPLPQRTLGVLGVLWPSKKFAEKDLIPGQAASLDKRPMVGALAAQFDLLQGGFDHPQADTMLDQAKALLPKLPDSPQAQVEFVKLVRGLLAKAPGNDEGNATQFMKRDELDLLNRLSAPLLVKAPGATGHGGATTLGAAGDGSAAGIGSFFSGVFSGAANLLNLTTYYQMKDRAGVLGRGPVAALVADIAVQPKAPRIHLAGHSFGARLVTSVASTVGSPNKPLVASMTLLQAAFSHNGFAPQSDKVSAGLFRNVVSEKRVAGPVLVSHSAKDWAVGGGDPQASRVAGQDASALGDADDRFGGLGRNGPVHTPEAVAQAFGKVGTSYAFKPATLYSMDADKLIASHGDIVHPETAYALLCAMAVGA
jgi:dienelactone hydrolase